MSNLLRKAIDESREDLGTREARAIDWDALDRELFTRLDQERRLERSRAVGRRAPAWGVGAAVLAAAACFALIAGKTHPSRSIEAPLAIAPRPPPGPSWDPGSGELLIDGKPAATGATLRLGNVVETRGTSVTVDRPGKLAMILEAGTRATVTHVQGSLVLALDTGAVEAQVVPVASGEAFAVDVMGSRVAVHGTHLRVARDGDRIAVDLNEGVVVLGPAPREGSTVGTLVTAPAHADFEAEGLGALHVTHEASAVRAPNGIAAPAPPAAVGTIAALPASPATSRPVEARPSAPVTAPVVRPVPRGSGHGRRRRRPRRARGRPERGQYARVGGAHLRHRAPRSPERDGRRQHHAARQSRRRRQREGGPVRASRRARRQHLRRAGHLPHALHARRQRRREGRRDGAARGRVASSTRTASSAR